MNVEPEAENSAGKSGQETHEDEEASTRQDKLKWWQNPADGTDNNGKGWGCLLTLFILGAVIYWGYGSLNENGWIEHAHDTPVWIKGEWLVGEYRLCRMPLMPNQALPDSAHLLCGQGDIEALKDENEWPTDFVGSVSEHEFITLMAGRWSDVEQHFHVLPVDYWGRIDRSDRVMFSWRCQRNSNSLTCRAID